MSLVERLSRALMAGSAADVILLTGDHLDGEVDIATPTQAAD